MQVRRERISERMRYLQELLPGCDKVTGKARMLDEIINYVQSMQKQVEMQQPVAGFGMAMLVSSPYIAAQSAPQSAAATSVSASPAASVELGLDANGAVTWDIASQHLLSGFDAKF